MRLSPMFMALLALGTLTRSADASSRTSGAGSSACSTPLTLLLRSGPVPGAAFRRGPPARDIPPGPLTVRLPLYPGAVKSASPIPNVVFFQVFPPAYRKVAVAEFTIPAGYARVSNWYRRSLASCGFFVSSEAPLQQRGGPPYTGLSFTSRDGLRWPALIFRPVTPHLTLERYVVQALDLPPRPVASFLRGPFLRVSVLYRSNGVLPSMNHVYRFTITWPATIARLVAAVNRLTRIAVSGLGVGGTVIMSENAVLSFVRTDGSTRRVKVGGILDEVVVGRTRPLEDTDGAVMRLVHRIVVRRCQASRACV